ncbi:RING/U-box superfamily protein [Actinidia rufa]|uniref:RING/U-box superfamily protein n=1 Tax=Actinidia rufa TaxID=165716 RepID=A0A7J0FFR9_9ERIC|nr:RING/U-box superfamily protein [Actinidia rufa]
MGNKLGRRRQVMDEKYTRPQGLYQPKDVDHKKLRKLILDSKLAPCYPGDEDCGSDLEECPICFLEEQRVIEAKIRMRQQELQDDEERKQKIPEISSSSRTVEPGEVGYSTVAVVINFIFLAVPSFTSAVEGEEIVPLQEPCPSIRQSLRPRQHSFDGRKRGEDRAKVLLSLCRGGEASPSQSWKVSSGDGTSGSRDERELKCLICRIAALLITPRDMLTGGMPTVLHKVTLEWVEVIIHGGRSHPVRNFRVHIKYHEKYWYPIRTSVVKGAKWRAQGAARRNCAPRLMRGEATWDRRKKPKCYIEDPIVQTRQKEGWSCGADIVALSICNTTYWDDEFDLDLEDIMVMEAIWLSIQENGRPKNPNYGDSVPSEQYMTEYRSLTPAMPPLAESSPSPSGGLACAIAALAERQQTGGESSGNYNGNISTFNMLPRYNGFTNRGEQVMESYHPAGSSMEVSPEWGINHDSEVAGVVTSRASSDAAEDADRVVASPPQLEIEGGFQTVGGPIVPENFEEQMMLAMAVSLAEAQARTSAPGVAWP